MHLTAVVCTYNRYDLLPAAIEALFSQKDISAFDIIVVDNSPEKNLAADFASKFCDNSIIRFIHEDQPGLSNARNAGAHAARGDIVAYIDDDALALPTWAKALRQAFISFGSEVGAVGGPVEPLWSSPPPKWLSRRSLDMLSVIDWGKAAREIEPHEWLAGCNLAFRRDLLLEVGGFPTNLGRKGDDTLLLSNEENMVSECLARLGKKTIYTPDAIVRHCIPPYRLSPRWLVKRMAWQAISDAVSHPTAAIDHARWTVEKFPAALAKALRRLRFFWIMSRWKRSLSDGDLEIVYDTFNEYICCRP